MKLIIIAVIAIIVHHYGVVDGADGKHTINSVKRRPFHHENDDADEEGVRLRRQTSADQMVQNILQWLQGVYTQNSRRIRQGSLREYLPPSNTQKPRPFEPVGPGGDYGAEATGYPPAGSITPQPPFVIYTNRAPSTPGVETSTYPAPVRPQPSFTEGYQTGYPTAPTGYPSPTTGYPTAPTGYPSPATGYPSTRPTYPTPPATTRYTSPAPTYPPSTYIPPRTTTYPTQRPTYPTQRPTYPTQRPTYPTQRPTYPTPGPTYPTQRTTYPTPGPTYPSQRTTRPTYQPSTYTPTEPYTSPISTLHPDENNVVPSVAPTEPGSGTSVDDLRHPPHIHAIDAQCAKDMMTINIEFNRQFDGVIYSKGYYNMPECRYVNPNSGQTTYSFTLSLNACGTEFINAFETQGQSYLENILVLQNEPGIQEVWDTIRAVRCLWEGNLKESLSVSLSVGMLNQEIVTFSGDTAMARLDIQMGRGPFAPSANGLVKIGETMTLVVTVSGDPGFDIQVKDCRATDSTGDNIVPLTDDNGCVLKPKLFGAFQKTRDTGNTGASIIAYAFFSAFKFPDVMDLMIECNIELCKTNCDVCPNPDQALEPVRRRRRRRDLAYYNETRGDGVTMGKHLRVILPEDLSDPRHPIINISPNEGICMSTEGFIFSTSILISLLTISCLFSAYVWLKYQHLKLKS